MESRVSTVKKLFVLYGHKYSCQDIVNIVSGIENIPHHKQTYLSGSISSMLKKLVDEGFLKYSSQTTKRGGHIYELNKK